VRNTIIIAAAVILLGGLLAYFSLQDDAETPPSPPLVAQNEGTRQPLAPLKTSALPDNSENGSRLAAPKLGATPDLPRKSATAPSGRDKPITSESDSESASGVKPPSFDIVRIAKDRTAVIAGRAPVGSTVILSLGGKTLAEAPVSDRGEWVAVIDEPLPAGQTELDLHATLLDGRTLASKSIVAVIVPGDKPPAPKVRAATRVAQAAPAVAATKESLQKEPQIAPRKSPLAKAVQTVIKNASNSAKPGMKMATNETEPVSGSTPAPETKRAASPRVEEPRTAVAILLPKSGDAPARLLQRPQPKRGPTANKLSVDTVEYDDKGNVVVTGSAPKGATVRTYVDNKPVGVSQADKDKGWQLKPKDEVTPGSHTLRVDQVDVAGRVVNRIELPFVRVAKAEILSSTTARYRVIVQPGNSLWRIARRVYGSGNRYTVIYQANNDQIRKPDMIFPGQVFTLPTEN
jgi:nucleoid-associated protein YgaU